MHALARTLLSTVLALALVACGDAPAPAPAPAAAPPAATPAAPTLDTEALRARAAAALAANRLYSPAGDNAVEDYLGLSERQPGDAEVETALLDLAPYVIIGAEQATTARDFAEAERLIALLTRMDATAPAVPRLREALAAEQLAAEDEARALAEREAAEAEAATAARVAERAAAATSRRTEAAVASATARSMPAAPTPRVATPAMTPAAPSLRPPPVSAPPPVSPSAPVAARALIRRVPARFPESALRRRLEGEVEVAVTIRPDGTVASVEVVRADPPGVFDREAVLAVRRWRYAPADSASEARVVLQFRRPS